jgi:chorismate mutase
LRKDIRKTDKKIVQLVSKRISTAKEIGKIKRKRKLPVRDFKVEKEVVYGFHKNCGEMGLETPLGEEIAKILIKYSIKAQLEDEK